jgi:hypothetical protein
VDVNGESSSTLLRGKSKSLHMGGSARLGEIQWQMISDSDSDSDADGQARAAAGRFLKF